MQPITKRQLGWILIAVGVLAMTGTVAVDWIGAGQWGGIGPAQALLLALESPFLLVGLSLLPLGDRPA